ncbi:MAG: CDP-diacylglycerol--serine O-phosphatidyltransferase [Alphaproteobacteria bacterium]|nr:CDP-diacylglycerol--serine O-phosphatidyltransferase [Alphaproteobacteria bacterium]
MAASRRRRLKELSINKLLPNVLTVLALCAGLTAIRFGLQERWEAAVWAVIIAGIFDGLDGRIARLLRSSSKFGAELDSLSDVVSFGVAPAFVLYLWTMNDAGHAGWVLVLLFTVCCGLRLARFNTMLGEPDPPWAHNFFTGVPAPAAAGLVLLPMILSFLFGDTYLRHPIVNGAVLLMVSGLMVSQVPTYSFKTSKVPYRLVLPSLLLVGLLAAFATSRPWVTVSLIGLAYVLSIPLSVRAYRKLKSQMAERDAEAAGVTPLAPFRDRGERASRGDKGHP